MITALITGAAGGIGREFARQLAARGTTVIAVCRKPGVELPRLPVRVEADIDIATDAGCAALATRVAGVPLDLVIHNAGILFDESLDALDVEAIATIRRQFEVNALAPLRLTALLAPQLARGAKLVVITSRMGSIADNTSGEAVIGFTAICVIGVAAWSATLFGPRRAAASNGIA